MSHSPALPAQHMGVMSRVVEAPEYKRCWLCEETLPVADFGPDRSRRDGLQLADRVCMRRYNREHETRPGK